MRAVYTMEESGQHLLPLRAAAFQARRVFHRNLRKRAALWTPTISNRSTPMQDNELPSMPLIGHLTELRTRLIRALAGVAVAYGISLTFTGPLWKFVCE